LSTLCGGDTQNFAEEPDALWFTALLFIFLEAFVCSISLHWARAVGFLSTQARLARANTALRLPFQSLRVTLVHSLHVHGAQNGKSSVTDESECHVGVPGRRVPGQSCAGS
jgi:hypothetical protein